MDADRGGALADLGKARLARWLRRAQWFVIPALVFGAMEWAVRDAERREMLPIGWNWPDAKMQDGEVPNYIFIGSSRVGGSIDTDVFQRQAGRHSHQVVEAINLGHGWSYLVQNYLWLRNLSREHPLRFRNATVVAEAPGGLLGFECQDWHDRWFEPGQEHLLIYVLRGEDLARLWTSPMELEDKLRLSFGFLARKSEFITRRAAVGNFLANKTRARTMAWSAPFIATVPAPVASNVADLPTNVGIRTDQEAVARNRQLAIELAKQPPAPEKPPHLPGGAVIDDIAALVRAAGGSLMFFEMPLHSTQAAGHKTPEWKARRKGFAQRASKWGAPVLTVDFHAADEDYPDIWHLRRSLAPDFTSALTRSIVAFTTASRAKEARAARAVRSTPDMQR